MISPVGVGIDLVDVARFRSVLSRRPRVAERLFSERERDDAPHVEGLAARFAAKEATWKALGVGLGATGFRDVEVQRTSSGAPTLVLRGRAAELARQQGVARWHVSLTHTATTAAAVVMAS